MGVRYSNTLITTNGAKIRAEIHDKNFVGTATDIEIVANGILFKSNGEPRDIFINRNLTSCKIDFYLSSPGLLAWYNDLVESEEGTYFLKIEKSRGGDFEVAFTGMILTDSIERNDDTYPILSLEAVDGLTVLKGVDYDFGNVFIKTLGEIMYECVRLNPVVDAMYGPSDSLLHLESSLAPDHPYYSDNGNDLWGTVMHTNFFFDRNEDVVTPWSAFQVLEVLCSKYLLRISYYNGLYYITSVDVVLNPSFGNTRRLYDASGGYVYGNSTSFFNQVDINNKALYGGRYINVKGYRQVRIEASKEGSNKYLGQNIVQKSELYTPLPDYFTLPPMIKGQEFELHMDIFMYISGPLGDTFWGKDVQHVLKIYFKFTDQETSDVFYADIFGWSVFDGNKPFVLKNNETERATLILVHKEAMGYQKKLRFIVPSYSKDRKIEVRYEFAFYKNFEPYDVGMNLRQYEWSVYWSMGVSPLGQTSTAIPINAYVDDTSNTGTYELKIYSSDMYGADGTLAFMYKPGVGIDRPANLQWRIGLGAADGLEKAMATYMIKYLVHGQEVLTIPVNLPKELGFLERDPSLFGSIFYKGKTFVVTKVEVQYLDDVVLVTGVRVSAPSSKTVTTNGLVVRRPAGGTQEESIALSAAVSATQNSVIVIEHVNVASGTEITIPGSINIGKDIIYSTIEKSLIVFVDGVAWTIVQTFNPSDRRPRCRVDRDNGKIIFNRALSDSVIKIVFQNNLVKDYDYTSS